MINILSVWVGEKYGFDYVNRLRNTVAKNLTVEFKFYVFVDSEAKQAKCKFFGLNPILVGSLAPEFLGWWYKLAMFSTETQQLLEYDHNLYLDLDTILTDNIDELTEPRFDFAMLRDFNRDWGLQSSIMAWRQDSNLSALIWLNFAANPGEAIRTVQKDGVHLGDQTYIEKILEHNISSVIRLQDVFPGKIISYKLDYCKRDTSGFSVVVFHGRPSPLDLKTLIDNWK